MTAIDPESGIRTPTFISWASASWVPIKKTKQKRAANMAFLFMALSPSYLRIFQQICSYFSNKPCIQSQVIFLRVGGYRRSRASGPGHVPMRFGTRQYAMRDNNALRRTLKVDLL